MRKTPTLLYLFLLAHFSLFCQTWSYESVSRIAHIDNFNPLIGIANEHHTIIAGRIDDPAPGTDDNYIIIDGVEYSNLIEGATLSGNPSNVNDFINKLFLDEHRLVMVGVIGFGTTKVVVYDIQSETIEFVRCVNLNAGAMTEVYLEGNHLYIAYSGSNLNGEARDCTNNATQTPLTSNDPAILKFDITSGEMLAEIHFDNIAEQSFSVGDDGFIYVAELSDPSGNHQAKVYKLDDNLNIVSESGAILTNAVNGFFGPRLPFGAPLKAVTANDGKTYVVMHAGVRVTVLDENLDEVEVPAQAFDDVRYLNYETYNRGIEFLNDSFFLLGVAETREFLAAGIDPDNDTDGAWLKKIELSGLQSVGLRGWITSSSTSGNVERPLWLGMGIADGKLKLLGYSQASSALYLNGTQIADGTQGSDVATLYEATVDVSTITGTNRGIGSFSISDPNGAVNLLDNHNVVYSSVDPSLITNLTVGRTPESEVGSYGTGVPPVSPSASTTHNFSAGNTFYTYTLDTSSATENTDFFVGYLESATTGTLSVASNAKDTFKVFPNPFTESLNIGVNNTLPPLRVSVYDLTGKLVLKPNLSQNKVSLSPLKSGIYFLKIESENSSEIKRVIKQ